MKKYSSKLKVALLAAAASLSLAGCTLAPEYGPTTDYNTPSIGQNGNWWIGKTDTGITARGHDGLTPHIGENGNWWIGDTDTGVPAIVQAQNYELTFNPNGGELPIDFENPLEVEEHKYAELPLPTKTGRTFLGWYTGFGPNDGRVTNVTPIESDLNLIAEWNTYTVTWVDGNGDAFGTPVEVNAGATVSDPAGTPVKDNDDDNMYTFSGWDYDGEPIHSDLTITAEFDATPIPRFTVTWLDGDGETFATTQVKEGQVAVAPAGTPTKSADPDGTTYEFTGWDYDGAPIHGDLTINATFDQVAAWPTGDVNALLPEYGMRDTIPAYDGKEVSQYAVSTIGSNGLVTMTTRNAETTILGYQSTLELNGWINDATSATYYSFNYFMISPNEDLACAIKALDGNTVIAQFVFNPVAVAENVSAWMAGYGYNVDAVPAFMALVSTADPLPRFVTQTASGYQILRLTINSSFIEDAKQFALDTGLEYYGSIDNRTVYVDNEWHEIDIYEYSDGTIEVVIWEP